MNIEQVLNECYDWDMHFYGAFSPDSPQLKVIWNDYKTPNENILHSYWEDPNLPNNIKSNITKTLNL